jgi:hypothetical protein
MIALALLVFVYLLAEIGGAAMAVMSHHERQIRALMVLAVAPQATPKQLRKGAACALTLGYRQTAVALLRRAEFGENVALTAQVVGETAVVRITDQPAVAESPWPDEVGEVDWRAYLRSVYLAPAERFGIGAFGLTPRLLERLGLMTNVRRTADGWVGEWAGAMTEAAFARSLPAQVQAVTAISLLHQVEIGAILDAMVGKEIEGQTATVSGLLAVALRAGGAKGLESWLTHETDRGKFARTTEAYCRSNGIF